MEPVTYAILLDVIVGIALLIAAKSGWHKGFLRMAVLLVGYIAAVVLSFWLSKWAAGLLYEHFIRDAVAQSIDRAVASSAEGLPFAAVLTNIFDLLPGFIVNPILAGFGGEDALVASLQETTGGVIQELGPVIAETVVEPIVTSLLQMFSCLLIFIICVIIVKAIAALFQNFYSIPILGPVNALLGAALGLAKAVIFLWLAALVVSMVIALSADSLDWLNSRIIEETVLFRPIYQFAAGV